MKMDGDDIILVATYETMSTGVSINNIMAIHFPDGGKSRIRIRQSCGRGLRLHPKKDYLQVFDYVDNFTKYYGEKVSMLKKVLSAILRDPMLLLTAIYH